ncbi:L-rhamnose mutarotase [Bauldia litoralis]|uniref:L-rhamnose mutarotase n=1 Tax=Bauldia litoralis TaxID=665467 RepID=A0A1G6B354_9HYPH|nr:L-rhamnose mutarotase [Bauldia litoralis]SDB15098.1 L-rhamnose mutarotase [Bauldia litoralis]
MERMGQVLTLKPDTIDEYKRLHRDVWPAVLQTIADCNIRNYSIFLKEPENLLFAYWEYHGTDFAADMKKMDASEDTQRWWEICGPMQEPLPTRKEGEWWARMEQVFFTD